MHQKYGAFPERFTIEERTERHCFANNILHVMKTITQPLVMIFQHDHYFTRPVDCTPLIALMKDTPINYIGFMNKSVEKLPHCLDQHMGLRTYFSNKVNYHPAPHHHQHEEFRKCLRKHYASIYPIPLIPLLFWYDKVHIAKREYYLEVVFSKKGILEVATGTHHKTQSFVEDSFGTIMERNIQQQPSLFE